jgi:hypothetical protein
VCMHFSTSVVMHCSNNLWTAPMRILTKAIEKCTYVIRGHCKQSSWEFFCLKWLQAEVTVLLLETVASGSDSSLLETIPSRSDSSLLERVCKQKWQFFCLKWF